MSAQNQIHLYIGTYNRCEAHAPVADGLGLVTCLFDLETGTIERRDAFPDVINSSYLASDLEGKLFCTSESLRLENAVHGFQINNDGSLTHLGAQASRGFATCHLAILPGEKVAAASYMEGCLSVFAERDGKLEPADYHFDYEGSGPNAARQEAPQAHQVVLAPNQRWFYVVDLGSDCLWQHDVALTLAPLANPMPAGHGARHMVFHPSLPRAYVLGEMSGAVTVCDWDEMSGALTPSTITQVIGDDASVAASRVHPTGKALWISLRSTHSLQVFQLDEKGEPTEAGEISLGDGEPRDFAISPDGRWLVCANQSVNHLAVIELNLSTGLPSGAPTTRIDFDSPCALLFMPNRKH